MKIKAIIWDYDETLVDTRNKNLNVTRSVINEVTGSPIDNFAALLSLENYVKAHRQTANWREFYMKDFELSEDQVDYAGSLWTKYQLLDKTRVDFFKGIKEILSGLSHFPHGIVSQNSQETIRQRLTQEQLLEYFNNIVGYEEVPNSRQKPHPEGLLTCINQITELDDESHIIYIGDHETDSECAFRANESLGRQAVINIAVCFSKPDTIADWTYKPDHIAFSPMDLPGIMKVINNSG